MMTVTIGVGAEPIPGYRLLDRLGIGGFGEVWRAVSQEGNNVALKIIPLINRQSEEELQSLQLLAGIRHPRLLHIVGHWVSDQHLLIATELADGTLQDAALRYRDQGLRGIPRDELVRLLSEAAEALDYLNAPIHEHCGKKVAIQHRDVKPDNIFCFGQHVRVGDFGLVKVLEQLSETHSGKGTLLYAPPEMLEGALSRSSDQYSLALTYCWLLTGDLPFAGSTSLERLWQRVKAPPVLEAYPESDRPILATALALHPEDRYPSCQAFLRELERAGRSRLPSDSTMSQRRETIAATLSPSRAPAASAGEHEAVARPLPSGFLPVPSVPIHASGYPLEIICEMDGSEMVLVPEGEFLYGPPMPDGGHRRVFLSAYYIDKYPITNAQFQWFCRSTGYARADRWSWGDDGQGLINRSAHPAVWLTWDDAMAFCQWAGKMLPTEAQWEKAARGVDGRAYPWGHGSEGDEELARGNWQRQPIGALRRTQPVGDCGRGVSPFGCHDMAGNVWEWCRDWFDPEVNRKGYRNPLGPPSGKYRVVRGGSWANVPELLTTTFRNHLSPDFRGPTVGFRAVLLLDPDS